MTNNPNPMVIEALKNIMPAMMAAGIDLTPVSKAIELISLSATPAPATEEAAREAISDIDADYMTSEKHHPGYVLIPTTKFDQLVAARDAGGLVRTVPCKGCPMRAKFRNGA